MELSEEKIKERQGIKPGMKVKSWDFEPMEGREDRFVIGTVTENNGNFLTVRVEEDAAYKRGFRLEIQTPLFLFMSEFPERIEIVN